MAPIVIFGTSIGRGCVGGALDKKRFDASTDV